jgi:hypothetical protein
MKLRRWCVTVMDNWTPTREFFTLSSALRWRFRHAPAHLFRWEDGEWRKVESSELVAYLTSP